MNYRYTVNTSQFLLDQRAFYEENGYIMFRKLVPDKDLDICEEHFIDICNNKKESEVMTIMRDRSLLKKGGVVGEYLINKIQDFLLDDIFFEHYARNKNIVDVVRNIIGDDITGVHSMLINKPPDSAYDLSRHPLHQDLHYFPFRPADRIVASWTAMERINEDNGCLFACPGSHKIGKLFPHVYPDGTKNSLYHGVQGFEQLPRINLLMEKGDTVFFHPLLLHGSGPNKTKGFRKAISVHYAYSDSDFIQVEGTSQANLAEEITKVFEKKTNGSKVSYIDIWKLKSRLVHGSPGSFQRLSHL